ncbi:MAG: hypothetical protein PUJ80_01400 [Verrucomicrobiota bacterium]|nr:hypothetical protein [Verrucomicrobiota bacterium]
MNPNPSILLLALFHFVFCIFSSSAAVPLRWTVETSRVQPAVFDAYQGETLTFEAALQSKGKPLEAPLNYSFFWQTNGMGSTYWEAPCPVPSSSLDDASTNVLFATFTPSMDVGARAYNCFIGSPSNIYHAAFQLRLRPSPGATPNALPLPTPVIDFARVRVLNPPWTLGGGGGYDTNAVERIANAAVETNAVTVCLRASVSSLESSKLSKSDVVAPSGNSRDGQAADAKVVRAELDSILSLAGRAQTDATTALYDIGETKDALNNVKITANEALWAAERLETNKADRSMISATNTTFSHAVMAVTQDFKTNTYTKTETDALIAANKPEYEDVPSNVVWRIEAEGGRFFFKPVRPIHTED